MTSLISFGPRSRLQHQSADVPTRFLILVIGNEHFTNELHEIGRCFGTLMSDDVFRGVAYKCTTKEELLVGLSEMFDKAWLLPPNEWDPSIMLDPPALKVFWSLIFSFPEIFYFSMYISARSPNPRTENRPIAGSHAWRWWLQKGRRIRRNSLYGSNFRRSDRRYQTKV